MSAGFVLAGPAAADVEVILSYLVEVDGPAAAVVVLDGLRNAFQSIADAPEAGHRREDLAPLPVRFRTIWSHLIVYDPASRPVHILRVLHGARGIGALLGASLE